MDYGRQRPTNSSRPDDRRRTLSRCVCSSPSGGTGCRKCCQEEKNPGGQLTHSSNDLDAHVGLVDIAVACDSITVWSMSHRNPAVREAGQGGARAGGRWGRGGSGSHSLSLPLHEARSTCPKRVVWRGEQRGAARRVGGHTGPPEVFPSLWVTVVSACQYHQSSARAWGGGGGGGQFQLRHPIGGYSVRTTPAAKVAGTRTWPAVA